MITVKRFTPVRNRVPVAKKAEFEMCSHLQQNDMADGYSTTLEGDNRLITYLCKACFNEQYLAHQDELNECTSCLGQFPNHQLHITSVVDDGETTTQVLCQKCDETINAEDGITDGEGDEEE